MYDHAAAVALFIVSIALLALVPFWAIKDARAERNHRKDLNR